MRILRSLVVGCFRPPRSIFSNQYAVGNSQYDVAQRLAGTVNYELPFAKMAKGLEAIAAKGWAVNAAGFVQTGLPFGVANGAALAPGPDGGLDRVCSGKSSHPTLPDWLNLSCFVQPTVNTYGTLPPKQFSGPRLNSVDFSIAKNFDLTERLKMQFRTEIFSLFNTPNFANPGGTSGNASTNVTIPLFSPSGVAGGVAQPAANSAAVHVDAVTARDSNSNAREVQFGVKFPF